MAFIQSVKKFIRDEEGVVTVEYALAAAIVGVGMIVVLATYRKDLADLFTKIGVALGLVEGAVGNVAAPSLNVVNAI